MCMSEKLEYGNASALTGGVMFSKVDETGCRKRGSRMG
jgi:hypothetical protein